MSALIPYVEPPIPRVALEIESLRQRLEAAEAELKAQQNAPAPASAGAPIWRQLAVVSAVATAALVVIAGSLVWSMTEFGPPSQPVNVVTAAPVVARTPQLAEPSLPASAQSAQSLEQAPPGPAPTPKTAKQAPPARAQNAQTARQTPSARAQGVQASRQASPVRTQSVQSARQKPPAPGQAPPAQMQMAQSSFRGGPPFPYYRPSIVLPPQMRPGYMW